MSEGDGTVQFGHTREKMCLVVFDGLAAPRALGAEEVVWLQT